MSEPVASRRLTAETAILAGRLEEALANTGSADARHFLRGYYQSVHGAVPLSQWEFDPLRRHRDPADLPLARLARLFSWDPLDAALVLLAGLPEEHEGLAAILRTLHPRGEPRASVGLAWHLFARDLPSRSDLRRRLEVGAAVASGAVRVTGDAPFPERSLQLAEGLWPALHGVEAWPAFLGTLDAQPVMAGLEEWFDTPAAAQARAGFQSGKPVMILVAADTEHIAFSRALAFTSHAGARPAAFALPAAVERETEELVQLHSAARGVTPVLRMAAPSGPGAGQVPAFPTYAAPVVAAVRAGTVAYEGSRPLLMIPVEPLSATARQRMWSTLLPALAAEAPTVAAQFPVEPASAAQVANDLAFLSSIEQRPVAIADIGEALRSRANQLLTGGIQLVRPKARWSSLVLPPERERQLREAVNRLREQARVLDEWGFLRGRPGARGVRLLFAGPPGTGKTLAAEVMANELAVDLLLVDISRVVSKWIGETEKNLAAVFDTAEKSRAVLFFDEADALFGKRTEISDAHDRYANLETAYLLARLERFDGLAILATNLRNNMDPALARRMEFSIDFTEPDREERLRLWRAHIPETAPLAEDVDLNEIAALFPIVGGLIRNAAVAAGFVAASDGRRITRRHLVGAIRREYEKASRAFPSTLESL